jgi:hypothetical protein
MLYLSEITGVVYIAVDTLPRFITNNMQEGASGRNQSNGSFPFVNLAMTLNIVDMQDISV